jgi:hypothetical protein
MINWGCVYLGGAKSSHHRQRGQWLTAFPPPNFEPLSVALPCTDVVLLLPTQVEVGIFLLLWIYYA